MDRDVMLKIVALPLGFYAAQFLLDALQASETVTVSVEGLYLIAASVFAVVHLISSVKTIIRNVRLRRQIRSAR